jgi:hypothetical protein
VTHSGRKEKMDQLKEKETYYDESIEMPTKGKKVKDFFGYALFAGVFAILLLTIFMIYYSIVGNADKNVSDWNNILNDRALTSEKITGVVKDKTKHEGENDKSYTLIITDDECMVDVTKAEYESISVGDTVDYYLCTADYPNIVRSSEEAGGRVVIRETVSARALSQEKASKEALSLAESESGECPSEWVFCHKHKLIIYLIIAAIAALIAWAIYALVP